MNKNQRKTVYYKPVTQPGISVTIDPFLFHNSKMKNYEFECLDTRKIMDRTIFFQSSFDEFK